MNQVSNETVRVDPEGQKSESKEGRQKRKLMNYVVDPFLQFRFAGQVIGIILVFSLAFAGFAYILVNLQHTILELLQVDQSVKDYANYETWYTIQGMAITLILFVIIAAVYVIIETHKVVGAKYAINKYIKEKLMAGNYDEPLKLRKSDFFQDVAESLNEFVAKLKDEK